MPGVIGHVGLGALILAMPVVAVTTCVVLVAVAALAARQPATRRHYLQVIAHLTQFVRALRARR